MNTKTMLRAVPVAALMMALPLASTAAAQAPALIPIQGELAEADGTPVDGDTAITIRVYDALTGGAALFEETQTVAVVGGSFTLLLGESMSLDLSLFADGRPLYVGVTVEDDSEMTPRLPLGTVPYAALAETAGNAEALQGMTPAAFAAASHTHGWGEISDVPADLADGDDDTTYTAGTGLSLSSGAFSVDPTMVQSRVTATCGPGSSIRAINADGTVTCQPDTLAMLSCADGQVPTVASGSWTCATPSTYADADAVAAVAAADAYVQNGGDTVDGALDVTGELSAGSGGTPFTVTKMTISRNGGSLIQLQSPDGTVHSLDVGTGTADVGNTHIAFRANGGEGRLYFNLSGSPSISCTLLHREDDVPRFGIAVATDAGNQVSTIWGNTTTPTFMLNRQGASIPLATNSSYQILCM